MKGFDAGLVFTPLVVFRVYRVFSCTKDIRIYGGMSYIATSSISPCSVSCIAVVFSNMVLLSAYVQLGNSLSCLEIPMGPLCATAQFDIMVASFDDKRQTVGTLFLYYLTVSFRLPSYVYKVSTVLGVHTTPKMAHNLNYLST